MTKTWDDVREKYIKKFTCAGGTKDCRLSHDRCFADNANYETVEKYFTTAFYQMMDELKGEIEGMKKKEGRLFVPISSSDIPDPDVGFIYNNALEEVLSLIPKEICNQSTKK